MIQHCDNVLVIKLAQNPIYHEKAKHVGVDCHFTMEKFEDVVLSYTSRVDQIVDFLTKAISRKQLNDVMSKLGMVNIYAST